MSTPLRVAEAAQAVGLTPDTLRYYEKAGLMPEVERANGGSRLYSSADIDRLTFIRKMRTTGMGISALREYFEAEDPAVRRKLLLEHREQVGTEIQRLQECLSLIEYKLTLYKEKE